MNDRNESDINAILQRGYSVDIGGFIQRGWEIYQSNLGLFIGFFLVTIVIGGALGFIPILGNIASIIIGGPLNAGSLIVAFKLMKGKSVAFEDFFNGFKNNYFLPTLLVTLATTLIAIICLIPVGISFVMLRLSVLNQQQPNQMLAIVGLLLALLSFTAVIYLSISYVFAIPFVVSRKLTFWSAMEASRKVIGKQWFSIFGLLLVLGLINFAGALMFFVGLLVTVPLTTCSIAAAFERIVGLPNTDDSFS